MRESYIDAYWRTKEGIHVKVSEMSEKHTENTIKLLIRNDSERFSVLRGVEVLTLPIKHKKDILSAMIRGDDTTIFKIILNMLVNK